MHYCVVGIENYLRFLVNVYISRPAVITLPLHHQKLDQCPLKTTLWIRSAGIVNTCCMFAILHILFYKHKPTCCTNVKNFHSEQETLAPFSKQSHLRNESGASDVPLIVMWESRDQSLENDLTRFFSSRTLFIAICGERILDGPTENKGLLFKQVEILSCDISCWHTQEHNSHGELAGKVVEQPPAG